MKDRMFFIIPFIWGKKVSVQEREPLRRVAFKGDE